jgi:ribokinase
MPDVEIVGLGALNIDHIYKVERILDDGETVVVDAGSSPGGSAANTVYGLAKLGMKTGFSGVIGDDDDGRILLQDFKQVGVDTTGIRVKTGVKTGSALCLSDKLGRRSLYVLPGANNRLSIDDLDLRHINQARILHLSSFADDRQFKVSLELIERLDSSVKLSFAPGALYAIKGRGTLAPILRRTYILFINESEIWQLTGEDIINGAESCLQQGCQKVVVTLGKGRKLRKANAVAYIRDAEHEYIIEATPDRQDEVDTTGAGDAFAAGFLYGSLKDKDLKECGRLGNIVAQASVNQIGAREGLPTLVELAQCYHELYKQEL